MATRKKAAKATAKPAVTKSGKKPVKKSAKKLVKLRAKRPQQKAAATNGLPRPASKPWGEAGRALDGVRILDFTHVQSGPTCTQLLAYMGADVIKVERPGVGDITRGQLRDVKGADSLYFTMLNGSKRSITIDSQTPQGQGNPRSAGQGNATCWLRILRPARSTAWGLPGSISTSSIRA